MGKVLIGTVQLCFTHEDPELCDAETAYVMALEVRLEYRRQGVAMQLMSTLEQYAVSREKKRLTLEVEPDNTSAILFYERMQYQLFKDSSFIWDGTSYATHCLEKQLGT